MSKPTHDVAVIGGGLAGLSTANRAAELGLSAIVLEQGRDAQYFCNSRLAGGLVHVAFKDMTAPMAERRDAVQRLGADDPTTHLARLLAEDSQRALEWLKGEGARFIKGGPLEFMRWVLAPPRPRRPGLDWRGRGPDVLLRQLETNLEKRGGILRRATSGHPLTRLREATSGHPLTRLTRLLPRPRFRRDPDLSGTRFGTSTE